MALPPKRRSKDKSVRPDGDGPNRAVGAQSAATQHSKIAMLREGGGGARCYGYATRSHMSSYLFLSLLAQR
jgi:hypothetical protein